MIREGDFVQVIAGVVGVEGAEAAASSIACRQASRPRGGCIRRGRRRPPCASPRRRRWCRRDPDSSRSRTGRPSRRPRAAADIPASQRARSSNWRVRQPVERSGGSRLRLRRLLPRRARQDRYPRPAKRRAGNKSSRRVRRAAVRAPALAVFRKGCSRAVAERVERFVGIDHRRERLRPAHPRRSVARPSSVRRAGCAAWRMPQGISGSKCRAVRSRTRKTRLSAERTLNQWRSRSGAVTNNSRTFTCRAGCVPGGAGSPG